MNWNKEIGVIGRDDFVFGDWNEVFDKHFKKFPTSIMSKQHVFTGSMSNLGYISCRRSASSKLTYEIDFREKVSETTRLKEMMNGTKNLPFQHRERCF